MESTILIFGIMCSVGLSFVVWLGSRSEDHWIHKKAKMI